MQYRIKDFEKNTLIRGATKSVVGNGGPRFEMFCFGVLFYKVETLKGTVSGILVCLSAHLKNIQFTNGRVILILAKHFNDLHVYPPRSYSNLHLLYMEAHGMRHSKKACIISEVGHFNPQYVNGHKTCIQYLNIHVSDLCKSMDNIVFNDEN